MGASSNTILHYNLVRFGICMIKFRHERMLIIKMYPSPPKNELPPEKKSPPPRTRIGVKYSTCTWYLYLSTYLSVLDVLEYLVYGNVKVLVLVLVLDQKVLGT